MVKAVPPFDCMDMHSEKSAFRSLPADSPVHQRLDRWGGIPRCRAAGAKRRRAASGCDGDPGPVTGCPPAVHPGERRLAGKPPGRDSVRADEKTICRFVGVPQRRDGQPDAVRCSGGQKRNSGNSARRGRYGSGPCRCGEPADSDGLAVRGCIDCGRPAGSGADCRAGNTDEKTAHDGVGGRGKLPCPVTGSAGKSAAGQGQRLRAAAGAENPAEGKPAGNGANPKRGFQRGDEPLDQSGVSAFVAPVSGLGQYRDLPGQPQLWHAGSHAPACQSGAGADFRRGRHRRAILCHDFLRGAYPGTDGASRGAGATAAGFRGNNVGGNPAGKCAVWL